MLLVNIILYAVIGDWFEADNDYLTWYMFFGGCMAAFNVSMLVICPGCIGFAATYICVMFGTLIMSIIFDYIIFGVDGNPIN